MGIDQQHALGVQRVEAVKMKLKSAGEYLAAGGCICIRVNDEALGRALVDGDSAILKQMLDGLGDQNPQYLENLNASSVNFEVLDLGVGQEPEKNLDNFMQRINKEGRVDSRINRQKSFSVLNPGKIIAILGADQVSQSANIQSINVLAKYCPTVFILNSQSSFENLNPHLKRALGEYSDVQLKAE